MLWSTALFVVIRTAVVAAADLPTVSPDEYGSWAIARHLAGAGGDLWMADMPRYPIMGGVALAPVEWLGLGPVASYRLGLVVMAALVMAAALLLRRAAALVLPREPVLAAGAYALTLLFPATVLTTSFTWAEPMVLACWAVLTWSAVTIWVRPVACRGALIVGSVTAGLAPFVHGRLLFFPLLWVAMLVGRAMVGRRGRGADRAPGPDRAPDTLRRPNRTGVMWGLGAIGLVVVTAWLTRRVDLATGGALWSGGAGKDRSHVLGDLGNPELWGRVAMVAVGQLWYGVVASMGLAVAGVAALAATVRRPSTAAARPLALLLSAAVASVYVTSVGVMASGLHRADGRAGDGLRAVRWDHHFYGRYIDAAVLVVSIVGMVALWRLAGTRRALHAPLMATGLVAVGGIALAVRLSGTGALDLKPYTVAGLAVWSGTSGTPHVFMWCLVGSATAIGIGSAARVGRTALVRTMSAVVVVGALLGARTAMQLQHDRSAPDLVSSVGQAPAGGGDLVISADAARLSHLRVGVFPLQFQFLHRGWSTELSSLDSSDLIDAVDRGDGSAVRPTVLVIAHGTDPEGDLPAEGWQLRAEFEGAELWSRT